MRYDIIIVRLQGLQSSIYIDNGKIYIDNR